MADDVLTVLTNGGSQVFNKVSMLSLLPLHANVNTYIMAMIISLYCASDIPVVRVTLNTSRGKYIIVHIYSGKVYQFTQCVEDIYYFGKV